MSSIGAQHKSIGWASEFYTNKLLTLSYIEYRYALIIKFPPYVAVQDKYDRNPTPKRTNEIDYLSLLPVPPGYIPVSEYGTVPVGDQ